MKEKLKWIWITTLIILVVSLILAFNLKSHYNHVHDKQK
ncbi:MAG: alpha/beta hydrolase, partial [Staphylococcus epidermidis]|nr:alpha/beta hydrolase [Staphylococcus epidermidis]